MPGAGKSTLGIMLAKALAKNFVDTDVEIQLQAGKTLQDIVDTDGYLSLRNIEEQVLLKSCYQNHVIATGGSAVYSDKAMRHLQSFGATVFLDLPLAELQARLTNLATRGLARKPNQSLQELYDERRSLYQHYANITIDCSGKSQDEIVTEIINKHAQVLATQ